MISVDKFSSLQLVNIAIGALVSALSMLVLEDGEIISSQTIISISQLSIVFLSILVSAASLEEKTSAGGREGLVALGVSVVVWLLLFAGSGEFKETFLVSLIFFVSLIIGEFSAYWRARIVNSEGSRFVLILINSFAAVVRLGTFILLLGILNALSALILSGAISNFSRSAVVFVVARRRESAQVTTGNEKPTEIHKSVSMLIKLGAFFDRNPSVLVIMAITSVEPWLGLSAERYSLSILIMTFSMAVSSVMWSRYENLQPGSYLQALKPLSSLFLPVLVILTVVVINMPERWVQAESLANLQGSPILLIIFPAAFGFTCGLNVFTYGSSLSLIKAVVIAVSFCLLGHFAFIVGCLLNILFFMIKITSYEDSTGQKEKLGVK
jgi:hypothetical protein